MDAIEVRMRCVEAAVKAPMIHAHADGPAVAIQETANRWAQWVLGAAAQSASSDSGTLHLPKKK